MLHTILTACPPSSLDTYAAYYIDCLPAAPATPRDCPCTCQTPVAPFPCHWSLGKTNNFFLPPHLKKNKLMHYCFGIWIILKFVCPTSRKIADTGATRNCSFTSYFGFPWYPLRQPSGSPFRRNPPWAPIGSNTQGASFRKISPGSPFGGFLCLTLTLSIQALARITVIKQY